MKNLIFISLILSQGFLFSQSKTISKKTSTESKPINFARLIRYTVVVKDTSKLYNVMRKNDTTETISSIYNYIPDQYIDHQSFNQFIHAFKKSFKNENTYFVYGNTRISKKEAADRAFKVDSIDIAVYDESGNESYERRMVCDSSRLNNEVDQIEFYESWYFDPSTYEIKKEVLGYSLLAKDSRFYDMPDVRVNAVIIFKDEEAFLKMKELTGQ